MIVMKLMSLRFTLSIPLNGFLGIPLEIAVTDASGLLSIPLNGFTG